MKKTTKIFGLLLTLFGLALVTGCTPITDTPEVPEETTYTVTIASDIENGTVTADKTSAKAGETVKLTVTSNTGYELDTLYVNDNAITGNTFVMPAGNVTVGASFTKTTETLNQEAADAVIAKINAIGTVAYTEASKVLIDAARSAYDALTAEQKALVSAETLAVLTTAETQYSTLKTEAETVAANQNAANAVIAKINAIGEVSYTPESEMKIADARTAYNALTSDQKSLVTNYSTLTEAESVYASLIPYTIEITTITDGKVEPDKTSAKSGETITLTVTPKTGYELVTGTLFVKNGNSEIAVTQDLSNVTKYTFTMPAGNVTVSATFNPTTANYTVKHLQQNIDNDGYTEVASETLNGTIGAQTAAEAKEYTGFTAQEFEQKTIEAGVITVIEIKYNRKTYTVSYENTSGENLALTNLTGVKHGTKITVDPTDYLSSTVAYITWSDGTNEYNTDGNNATFEITVTGNVTLTAEELWFKKDALVVFSDEDGSYGILENDNLITWKKYFSKEGLLSKNISKNMLINILSGHPLIIRYWSNGSDDGILFMTSEENFEVPELAGRFSPNNIGFTDTVINIELTYETLRAYLK